MIVQRNSLFAYSCPLAFSSFHHEQVSVRANSYVDGNGANGDVDVNGVTGNYTEEYDKWNGVFSINALNGVHADDGNGKLSSKGDCASPHDKGDKKEEDKYTNNSCVALGCDYASTDNACYDHPVHIDNATICDQLRRKEEQVHCKEATIHTDFNQLVCASSGHIRQLDMALDALFHLHSPQPSKTYLSLLQACNKFKSLSQAKRVHAHINLHGALLTSFLGDYLVMTLAKCGAVHDAYRLYVTLPLHTVFSCTAIISAYVECGEVHEALKVYQCMQDEGMEPDSYTFVSLFKACGSIQDLELGKHLHIYACKKGFTPIPHVSNTLISMYGKCGAINEADDVFSGQSKCNIVSWTTLLSAYIEQGQPRKVLWLYIQMQEEGLSPDKFALVIALQACGMIADKEQDRVMTSNPPSTSYVKIVHALHADAFKKDYLCDVFVGTALLTAYGKCGTLSEAENVFSVLTERNLVTWNAMLSAYMDQGQEEKALHLYTELQKDAINPEPLTFVLAFQACSNVAEKDKTGVGNLSKATCLEILQALHADFCKAHNSMDMVVATALLSSYAKCGAVVEAENLFDALSHCDVVSWNAMLTVYIEQGQGEKALCLYRRMQDEHMTLDDVTMINALLACSETGSLDVCEHLHFKIVCAKLDLNLQVVATLIHSYGNCAEMIDAWASFDIIPEPDAALWNACIAGYAGEGSYATTLCVFENANLAGMKACKVAFTSVLSACMNTGLIAEGLEYFESMRIDYSITPDLQHYNILVDHLARAGDFKKVENMLEKVDMQGNLNVWLFLLGACHTHSNIELAKQAFSHALTLQPKQATAYVLMSNIYANAELQE